MSEWPREWTVTLHATMGNLADCGLSIHMCAVCSALVVEDFMPAHMRWHGEAVGQTTVEWSVETVGGGESGSADAVRRWLRGWLNEYGDKYEISVQRRTSTRTSWVDASIADLELGG